MVLFIETCIDNWQTFPHANTQISVYTNRREILQGDSLDPLWSALLPQQSMYGLFENTPLCFSEYIGFRLPIFIRGRVVSTNASIPEVFSVPPGKFCNITLI